MPISSVFAGGKWGELAHFGAWNGFQWGVMPTFEMAVRIPAPMSRGSALRAKMTKSQ